MPQTIHIVANGETFEITDDMSLTGFLASRGQVIGRVVVEHNGSALSPSESAQIVLCDGDRLEIVRIVAGG